jgi:hypothetical protein
LTCLKRPCASSATLQRPRHNSRATGPDWSLSLVTAWERPPTLSPFANRMPDHSTAFCEITKPRYLGGVVLIGGADSGP